MVVCKFGQNLLIDILMQFVFRVRIKSRILFDSNYCSSPKFVTDAFNNFNFASYLRISFINAIRLKLLKFVIKVMNLSTNIM